MIIQIKNKDVELKYTFNSFKYMGDFNISELNEIEDKPFKIVPIVEMLLLGSLNHNPKVVFNANVVEEFLDEYMQENSIIDLMEGLMDLLQESNFFKSLQRTQMLKNSEKK